MMEQEHESTEEEHESTEEKLESTEEELEWMVDDLGEASDPDASSDEDVADLPNTFDSASDSYDSDAEFVEQNIREAAISDPNILLDSKDKTIQYIPVTFNPIERLPVTAPNLFAAKQGEINYSSCTCAFIKLTPFVLVDRSDSIC